MTTSNAIQVLARILEGMGKVRFVTNGPDALRMIEQVVPDLILLDAEMPEMSGFEVCEKVKANPRFATVPVIFVTSHDEPAFELASLEIGAADFISKPVNPPLVQARVRTQLRIKELTDELTATARTDVLTGLPNRREFDEVLEREWRRAERSGEAAVGADDRRRPLQVLQRPLRSPQRRRLPRPRRRAPWSSLALRRGDLVARYGGEEFVFVLPQTPRDGAEFMARQVLAMVDDLTIPHAGLAARPPRVGVGRRVVLRPAESVLGGTPRQCRFFTTADAVAAGHRTRPCRRSRAVRREGRRTRAGPGAGRRGPRRPRDDPRAVSADPRAFDRSARRQPSLRADDVELDLNPFRALGRNALAVFAAGLCVTAAAVAWQVHWNTNAANSRVDALAARVAEAIDARFRIYEYGLRGARGAVIAAGLEDLDRVRFRQYAESRDFPREFPAARGVAVVRRVKASDEAAFVADERKVDDADYAVLRIRPHDGDRYLVEFVEPYAANKRLVGFDFASETERRVAADRAKASGLATLTPPLTPAIKVTFKGPLIHLLLPIYRPGLPIARRSSATTRCTAGPRRPSS